MDLAKSHKSVLTPRESGQLIAGHSKDVVICHDGIRIVAHKIFDSLKRNELSLKNWKKEQLYPQTLTEDTVNWIFVLNSMNFSFWTDPDVDPFMVHYNGKERRGYWALCAVINRALEDGIPMTSPKHYGNMTSEQFEHIFRSSTNTPMPMLDQRLKHLHEAGRVLCEKFRGSFGNCITQCNRSATELLSLITENFSSFNDTAIFQNETVCFHKRAQLMISHIWACFEGEGYGSFNDIDTLTMFADYRVPQVLYHHGSLTYSANLMEILKTGKLLTPGQRLEVEIRGCTIWAVELIRNEVEALIAKSNSSELSINSAMIDCYLWNFASPEWDDNKDIPMHRIRSTFY